MNKEAIIYLYSGILLRHKETEILLLAAMWMDLEIVRLSELSQRDKYYIISLICGL